MLIDVKQRIEKKKKIKHKHIFLAIMDYAVLWTFFHAVKHVLLNIYSMLILFFYCDGVVLEILTDHKFQWLQELCCKPLKCNAVTYHNVSWGWND